MMERPTTLWRQRLYDRSDRGNCRYPLWGGSEDSCAEADDLRGRMKGLVSMPTLICGRFNWIKVTRATRVDSEHNIKEDERIPPIRMAGAAFEGFLSTLRIIPDRSA